MIDVKIKVKNDHRSLTEDFECQELTLSLNDLTLVKWIEKVTKDFGDDVDEVVVKTKMHV